MVLNIIHRLKNNIKEEIYTSPKGLEEPKQPTGLLGGLKNRLRVATIAATLLFGGQPTKWRSDNSGGEILVHGPGSQGGDSEVQPEVMSTAEAKAEIARNKAAGKNLDDNTILVHPHPATVNYEVAASGNGDGKPPRKFQLRINNNDKGKAS